MSRLVPLAATVALLLVGGCFVDAAGNGAGGAGGSASTQAATNTATGSSMTDPSTTGATSDATTTDTSTTNASTSGSTATGGGEGGMGGGPCPDSVLSFDNDDIAGVSNNTFDIPDNFALGAWVYAAQDPEFVANDGDEALSIVIAHGSLADSDGYGIGIVESGDDGLPFASFAVFPEGLLCRANAPIQWNQWVHIAGTYDDDIGDDIRLYVNGNQVAVANCFTNQPPVSYNGPFLIGGDLVDASWSFLGSVDDVFVKQGTSLPDTAVPITCGAGYVAAFSFETGLVSACANMIPLAADPAPNDPQIVCMQ